MLEYARSDTHFLLYIYDCMRNDLVDRSALVHDAGGLVQEILNRSNETALQTYEHPVYDVERGLGRGGWFGLIQRNMMPMSREQFAVYRKVHQWRDAVGRQEDEGIAIIMPNHVLFNIARALPRDMAGLLKASQPTSLFVRLRADHLLRLIRDTIATAAHEPTLADKVAEIFQTGPDNTRKSDIVLSGKSAAMPTGTQAITNATDDSQSYDITLALSSFWGVDVDVNYTQPSSLGIPARHGRWMELPVPAFPSGAFTAIDDGLRRTAIQTETSLGQSGGASAAVGMASNYAAGKRKAPSGFDADVAEALAPENGEDNTSEEDHLATVMVPGRVRKSSGSGSGVQKSAGINGLHVEEQSTAAFDYDVAPPVLHANVDSPSGRMREHPFNPYSKASQAPSGLRKKQDSRATKSFTFRQ